MSPFDYTSEQTRSAQPESKMPIRTYNDLQLFFLMRLARLLRQKREYLADEKATKEEWRIRLFNKTIYSTFRDCVDQGVGEDARLLFQQEASTRSF